MRAACTFFCGPFVGIFPNAHDSPENSDDDENEEDEETRKDNQAKPKDHRKLVRSGLLRGRGFKGGLKALSKIKAQKVLLNEEMIAEQHGWFPHMTTVDADEDGDGFSNLKIQRQAIKCEKAKIGPRMIQSLQTKSDLHTIEITNCWLEKIPPKLNEIESLRVLSLPHNAITSIQKEEGKAYVGRPPLLDELNLSHNKIGLIEPKMTEGTMVKSLKKFDLSHNALWFLPSDFLQGAENLLFLELSYNKLRVMPESMMSCQKLQILVLNHNQLEELPCNFKRFSELRKLFCSYNMLTSLPDDIGFCTKLVKIRCVANKLRQLPESVIRLGPRKESDGNGGTKNVGGNLEELLVFRNPLATPSITAFEMGGLEQALRLFDETIAERMDQELEQSMRHFLAIFEKTKEVDRKNMGEGMKTIFLETEELCSFFERRGITTHTKKERCNTMLQTLWTEYSKGDKELPLESSLPRVFRRLHLDKEDLLDRDKDHKDLMTFAKFFMMVTTCHLRMKREGGGGGELKVLISEIYKTEILGSEAAQLQLLNDKEPVIPEEPLSSDFHETAGAAAAAAAAPDAPSHLLAVQQKKQVHDNCLVIGITGMRFTGKKAIAHELVRELILSGKKAVHLLLDEEPYFKKAVNVVVEKHNYKVMNVADCFDHEKFANKIKDEARSKDVVIVTGLQLFHDERVVSLLDRIYFLPLEHDEALKRYQQGIEALRRTPGDFDNIYWRYFRIYTVEKVLPLCDKNTQGIIIERLRIAGHQSVLPLKESIRHFQILESPALESVVEISKEGQCKGKYNDIDIKEQVEKILRNDKESMPVYEDPNRYYFGKDDFDSTKINEIRSAESSLLLLKRCMYVEMHKKDLKDHKDLKEIGDQYEFRGICKVTDIDLYFCLLVYSLKPLYPSCWSLFDKFTNENDSRRSGLKDDILFRNEWDELLKRAPFKLERDTQEAIWRLLSWQTQEDVDSAKHYVSLVDFLAAFHIHDMEFQDPYIARVARLMALEYYNMSVEGMRGRLNAKNDVHASKVFDFEKPVAKSSRGKMLDSLPLLDEGEYDVITDSDSEEEIPPGRNSFSAALALKDGGEGPWRRSSASTQKMGALIALDNIRYAKQQHNLENVEQCSDGGLSDQSISSWELSDAENTSEEEFDAGKLLQDVDKWKKHAAKMQANESQSDRHFKVQSDGDMAKLMKMSREELIKSRAPDYILGEVKKPRGPRPRTRKLCNKRNLRDKLFNTDIYTSRQALRDAYRNLPRREFASFVKFTLRGLQAIKAYRPVERVTYWHVADPTFKSAVDSNRYTKEVFKQFGFVCVNNMYYAWPEKHLTYDDNRGAWGSRVASPECPGLDRFRLDDLIKLLQMCEIQSSDDRFTGHLRKLE